MDVYKGTGAFSGIAIGKILYYHKSEYQMRQYEITDVKTELNIFRQARTRVMEQLEDLYEKNCIIQGTQAEIFLRQNLLEGKSFQRAIESVIQSEKVNSAYAVMTTRDEMLKTFRTLEEPAIKERLDNMREISDRLIGELGGISPRIDLGDEPVIVVTESITPTELMEMDKDKLMAIVTHHGSDMSHAAIMAKTMNIPALLEIDTDSEWDGRQAIVDGYTGTLYIDPDEETMKVMTEKREEDRRQKTLLEELKGKENVTLSGQKINVYANIGNLSDVGAVLKNDAGGIGLFRSEFLYLENSDFPTEEQQFAVYKQVAENMAGKKVIIRTLDIGADKQVDYFGLDKEENPALGYRAIRICLTRKEIFKTQLRALYRAAMFGNISIMFPMIISVAEVHEIKAIIAEVKEELKNEGIPFKDDVELGVMIETPASVMISRELAKEVDFFSVGTNDLTQYTMAVDRGNSKVAYLYSVYNPAVIRSIKRIISAAANENIIAGMCGEAAADPLLTPLLISFGLKEFSVNASSILRTRAQIAKWTKAEADKVADEVMKCATQEEVYEILKRYQR